MRALLIVVLLAGVARADDAADALAELDRGMALFQAGDLAAARAAFAKARDLVPAKANPYRWLGLVDARQGRCADAVKELDTFIARVPPDDPRVVEAITLRDRCKEELQPKLGTLIVESTPPGAEVRLDEPEGAAAGVTPYRNEALPVGSHLVFVRKSGFHPTEKSVHVDRNETVRLDLALLPEPAAPVALAPIAAPSPHATEKRKSKLWIVGVVAGGVAVAALGIGLGVGLSSHSADTVLPPLKSQ